jgi:hypothetical protein
MKKLTSVILVVLLLACKEKKIDLSGTQPVKINDFIAVFPVLSIPFAAADTNISKIGDTTTIGYKAFTQFIPDSITENIISDAEKSIIHPVGRIDKVKEMYLLATLTHKKKTQLAVFVLDKKNKFLAAKNILTSINEDGYSHSVSINKEPTFLISKEKTNNEKQLQFSRVGWVYNSGKSFTVVMNDGNEDPKKFEIINPIDTLSHKNKFSGNYAEDNKNFISLRDGKNANSYIFFLHIEKKEGGCVGEIKGSLRMKTATTAIYQENGDPCVLNFIFGNNKIDIKETGSCGNKRGMNCLIDESFDKKKEPKSTKKKGKN